MRIAPIVLLAACALAATGAHAAGGLSEGADAHTTRELLDPAVPAAERKAAYEDFDARARAGDTYVQYVVGSLLRIGPGVEGSPAARDLDAAARYLSTAAAHGSLVSMAKMAEIELERKRPLEAMIWTQVYLHYELDPGAHESDDSRRGYPADLLHRATSALDPAKSDEMKDDLEAFVAAHDAEIRAGLDAMSHHYESGDTRATITHFSFEATVAAMANHRNDDLAEYLVAFDESGHASDAWMLDAIPDLKLGKDLRRAAMHTRVNAVEKGAGTRYALVPVQYTFGRHQIEPSPTH